jgi:hypothetical protein
LREKQPDIGEAMSESINAEFEAYVKVELGDVAVVSEGRFISPKIQNYFKVWSFLEAIIFKLQLENESLKQVARYETDVAAQAIADFEAVKAQLAALQKGAERYRWLRDRLQIRYETPMSGGLKRAVLTTRIGFGFLDSKMNPDAGWISVKSFDECRENVDLGIDAAIAGEAT